MRLIFNYCKKNNILRENFSMIFKLPGYIVNLIFEYDSTYRDYFNNTILELEECTSFFRVVTLKDIRDEKYSLTNYKHNLRYNLSFREAIKSVNYWNYEYLSDSKNGEWFLKWSKNYVPPPDYYKFVESKLDINLKNTFHYIIKKIKNNKLYQV